MTHSRFPRIVLAVIVMIVLSAAQTSPPQDTVLPVGSATITEIKGEVAFTSPDGTPVTAERGTTLSAESKIETIKGSVLLELQDGSQVLVKSHSSVVLRSPNEGKGFSLELFIGQIMVKVRKRLGETPSFRMGTPSAVITVRGTRFLVEVNKKHKTYVSVFEGVVEVEGLMPGSRAVLIRPGFFSDVEQYRAPEDARESNAGDWNSREGNTREGGGREGGGREGSGHEGRNPGTERDSGEQSKPQPKPGSEGKPD